jgi:phospho-N-acetylmuramoyl-pentapeptide-transferase
MLYHLLWEQIYPSVAEWPVLGVLNVFQYITFRTAMASMTALVISLLLGPQLIQRLQEFQIGQNIREDGPRSHQAKAGTPTMGGVLIVVSIVSSTLLWADLTNPFTWLVVASTLAFGAVGFADDYLKIVRKRSLGLRARAKIGFQVLTTLFIGSFLLYLADQDVFSTRLTVPFFKSFTPDLVLLPLDNLPLALLGVVPFFLFIGLVVVGSTNAVNLTDGLDGLAIGCVLVASGALTVLTYVTGHQVFAEYLDLQHLPQVAEVSVFCGAIFGASMGFLWYNAHPAEVFMGDVGSLALGGAIGTVAVVIKQELLLIFIGGIFVVEALSVMIQVGSFKLRGKRVFKMAPLHHHFELMGWTESKVIIRFWIVALLFALFSLSTLKLR